jgi:uncharacterized protein YjbI with pentapeptide repeats
MGYILIKLSFLIMVSCVLLYDFHILVKCFITIRRGVFVVIQKMCNLSQSYVFYSIILIFLFISCTYVQSYNPEHLERVLSGEKKLTNLDLDDADLSAQDLSDRDFTDSSMCRVKAKGSDFTRSILVRTNMTDANLQPLRKSVYKRGFDRKIYYQLTIFQDVQCKDVVLATKQLRGAYFVDAKGLTSEQQAHLEKYGAIITASTFTKKTLKNMVLADLGALSAGVNVYVLITGHRFKVLDQADCCRHDSEKEREAPRLFDPAKSLASQLKVF